MADIAPNSGFELGNIISQRLTDAQLASRDNIKAAVNKLAGSTTSAGKKVGGGALENPLFHPAMTARFVPSVGTTTAITHGYIVQQQGYGTGPGGGRYKLRFLFNPNDFTVEYLQQAMVYANPNQATADNQANSTVPNMQSMHLNLLFDRTYEIAVIGGALTPVASAFDSRWAKGCYADVEILERIVGIVDGFGGVQPIPVDIYFGAPIVVKTARDEKVVGDPGKPLKFSGYLTGMSVTYTHFSYNMTPVRCAIGVDWTQAKYTASTLATADGKPGEGSLTSAQTDVGSGVSP